MSYPPPAPAPRKSRKGLWIGLGALAFLFVACGVAFSGGNNVPVFPTPPAAQPDAEVAAPPADQPTGPLTTFGNGTFEVGTDIAAGDYRSPGAESSVVPMCYWEISEGGAIKDNNVATEGPSRMTVSEGQMFKSQGCEDWAAA